MQQGKDQTWANDSTGYRYSKSIHDSPFIRTQIPMRKAVNDSDLGKLESSYH